MGFSRMPEKSTTETVGVYTQRIAGELALECGNNLGHLAWAAPVEVGMMLQAAARRGAGPCGPYQEYAGCWCREDGGHVAHLDAKLALQHQGHRSQTVGGARGGGHNVVLGAASYCSWFTPMTMVMSSSLAGAVMMTFLAPLSMCTAAWMVERKIPVLSTTMSTSCAPQVSCLIAFGKAVDVPVATVAS